MAGNGTRESQAGGGSRRCLRWLKYKVEDVRDLSVRVEERSRKGEMKSNRKHLGDGPFMCRWASEKHGWGLAGTLRASAQRGRRQPFGDLSSSQGRAPRSAVLRTVCLVICLTSERLTCCHPHCTDGKAEAPENWGFARRGCYRDSHSGASCPEARALGPARSVLCSLWGHESGRM